jgi:hypothetical protein
MNKFDTLLSKIIDRTSDYVAAHRGVPVLIGVLLVVLNFVLLIIPDVQLGFVETTNLLLHLGVIIGLLGVLLGDALS